MLLFITLASSVYQDNEFMEGGLGIDQTILSSPLRRRVTDEEASGENACTCKIRAMATANLVKTRDIVIGSVCCVW